MGLKAGAGGAAQVARCKVSVPYERVDGVEGYAGSPARRRARRMFQYPMSGSMGLKVLSFLSAYAQRPTFQYPMSGSMGLKGATASASTRSLRGVSVPYERVDGVEGCSFASPQPWWVAGFSTL